MDKNEQRILELADEKSEEIIALGRDVWNHGEPGFREYETARIVAECLEKCGLEVQTGIAITGIKSDLKSLGESKAKIAVVGELDAIPIPNHMSANPKTGAAHCCGHNSQIAGMLGAAMILSSNEIRRELCGDVSFIAVPSEEYIDIEYKDSLIRSGRISFGSGKQEMLSLGIFEDIDVVLGCHTKPDSGITLYNSSMNGFINKSITFHGRSVHAASHPDEGIDALNAAILAMQAVNLQRESFRDEDSVRVHGCILNGGTAVNIVADTVSLEYSVRARTMSAVTDASKKIDRSMKAGAVATGCSVEIKTIPGYMPLVPAKDTSVIVESMKQVSGGKYPLAYEDSNVHLTASSDYGDISQIMPVLQFYTGGYSGPLHSINVNVTDEYLAYVVTAKMFALSAYKLLKNNAQAARKISDNFSPAFTRSSYIDYLSSLRKTDNFKL